MYRNRRKDGILIRANPRRGLVRVKGKDLLVPYERLQGDPDTMLARLQRLEAIQRRAEALLAREGLDRWTFQFDHSARRAGCCNYRKRSISISIHLAAGGSEREISNTLIHEAAHALVGKEQGHGAVWKSKAIELGGTGERTHRMEFTPPRWNVSCENHCWSHTAQRRNTRLICRKCGGKLVYSAYV